MKPALSVRVYGIVSLPPAMGTLLSLHCGEPTEYAHPYHKDLMSAEKVGNP